MTREDMTREDAETFDEIAEVLARRSWWQRYGDNDKGLNCPDDKIPSPQQLSEYIENTGIVMFRAPVEHDEKFLAPEGQCPYQDILFRGVSEEARSVGYSIQMMRYFIGQTGMVLYHMPRDSTNADISDAAKHCDVIETTPQAIQRLVEGFHRVWRMFEAARAELNDKVEDEWRRTGMQSRMQSDGRRIEFVDEPSPNPPPKLESLGHYAETLISRWQKALRPAKPFGPKDRAVLVAPHKIKADEVKDMPGFPGGTTHGPDNQPVLPGFEFDVLPSGFPAWLLWAYSQTGKSQGGVAPWDLRLWIAALLNLAIGDRDGEWHPVRVDTIEVENWLHPNGWANRRRHFHKLTEALHMMDKRLSWLPVPGVGSVAMLRPTVIPTNRSDPVVEFVVRVPRSAAHGARLNWQVLSQYGCESALKYRAYLSAMCMLAHSARRGGPITAEIERPLVDSHGRPIYRKAGGGRSVVARAKGELIPNSLAKMTPKLTDRTMAQVIGHDPSDRMSRRRARKAFDDLAADGVIDLRTNSNGTIGLFGPAREGRLVAG